ncbi:MAG: hypothetical protein V4726_11250 [Verrucomicrobiota bacterium]
MKRLWLTLLPCFWMLPATAAENELPFLNDLTLRNGQKLTKVQVLKVEPDGLRVEHKDGIGKLTLEVLPTEIAKRFNLSEVSAAEWRETDKKRKDEAAAVERREAVKKIIAASRADQEDKVRQQRLALYQQMRAGNFSYVDADAALRKSIALYNEAGREDLAAQLEEDRTVLKQQEIHRPSADLEARKQELANRVSQLENDLANARNQPPTVIYTRPDPVWVPSTTIYYNQDPVYIPVPVNPPPHCPPVSRPPWTGPGTCPPANYPPNGLPPVPRTLPPTIGPRQPDVRQPGVRQPQVPPISVPQPRVSPPPVRPINVPAVRPAPVYRPAPSYVPSRSVTIYPGNGGGGGRNVPRR